MAAGRPSRIYHPLFRDHAAEEDRRHDQELIWTPRQPIPERQLPVNPEEPEEPEDTEPEIDRNDPEVIRSRIAALERMGAPAEIIAAERARLG